MARTVTEIEQVMLDKIAEDEKLTAKLTNTSKTAIYRLFVYIVAFCIRTLELLFDSHRLEVEAALLEKTPHQLYWYRVKSLAFQYGFSLLTDSDKFDNTGATDEQIEDSKIIKYCAVSQADNESRLVVKIATETGGSLSPLSSPQKAAFVTYLQEIKDAGVLITVINYLPDRLYITARIYYDPLVLDADGASILTGGKPVEDAITAYIKNLPFNGELILASLVDSLQAVKGVKIPHLDNVSTSFIDPVTEEYEDPLFVDVKVKPQSGYFTVVNFDDIEYIPYVQS